MFSYSLFTFLIYTILPPHGWAEGEGLAPFLELNDQLTGAICDSSIDNKLPTLEVLAGGKELGPFWLKAGLTEDQLISWYLGDLEIKVSTPKALELEKKMGWKPQTKNQITQSICAFAVTQAKRQELLKGYVLLGQKNEPLKKEAVGWLKWIDPEKRSGLLGEQLVVPGWVEPREIERVRWLGGSHFREYLRLESPGQKSSSGVVVWGQSSMPLGFLYLSSSVAPVLPSNIKEQVKRKQFETYMSLMEFRLRRSLLEPSEQKKLFAYFEGVIKAYQIFPHEDQFKHYFERTRKILNKNPQKDLGPDFESAYTKARVLGSSVQFQAFELDLGLSGIWFDFLDKIIESEAHKSKLQSGHR